MFDRMADLHQLREPLLAQDEEEENPILPRPSAREGHVLDFLKQFDVIKQQFELLKENTLKLLDLKDKATLAILSHQEKKITAQVQPLIDETNLLASSIKVTISSLKQANDKSVKKPRNVDAAEYRIRHSMVQGLMLKFRNLLRAYQQAQNAYRTVIHEKMERQLLIIDPTANPQDVETVVESGHMGSFLRESIMGGSRQTLENLLADVQNQYKDLTQLQNSIKELQSLFMDVSLLAETQGDLIDNIERSIANVKDVSGEAVIDIVEAKRLQTQVVKTRSLCCLIFLLTAGVGAVLICWRVFNLF